MKKNIPSSPRKNSDSRPQRSAGRSQARPEGSRSFSDKPRSDSRPQSRSAGRAAPRSEGRPDSRSDSRSAPRSEGSRSFSDRPHTDTRPLGRSAGRSAPRSEGRSSFSDRPRSDSRPQGRSDSRSAPRTEGRPERSFSDRPRSDSRSAPRSEGRSSFSDRPRSDSRPQGRSDSRSAPRSEGSRSFSDRPRFDSRSSERPTERPSTSKPSFFDRPGASSRPRGTVHEREEASRPFTDRPRSSSRPQDRQKSNPQSRPDRPFPSTDRPKLKSAERPRFDNKQPESAAKPFVVYRKNPDEPQELKYYGFHACLKLWESRPDDIIRVYVDEKCVKQVSSLLKWCASKAKAYHLVSEEEMVKVSDSVHHEGLCILAVEPKSTSFSDMLDELNMDSEPSCLMYLDGVQNPHNIGSIMRVCAHFGIKYILAQQSVLPKVTPSAYRVAQGGAEYVKLVAIDDIKSSFEKLEQAGFKTVASSSHGGKTLYDYKFQPRMVIIMGSESEGVNAKLLEAANETLLIPGTGVVESLNVSVATGLFLGEYFRQVKV